VVEDLLLHVEPLNDVTRLGHFQIHIHILIVKLVHRFSHMVSNYDSRSFLFQIVESKLRCNNHNNPEVCYLLKCRMMFFF